MYTTTETIRMHVFSTPFHGCGNDRNASFMELAFGCLGLDPEPPPFFPPSCEKQELARNATRWARRSARAQKKGERRSFGSKPKGPNATFIELALRFFPHPENVPDHVTLRWREGGVPVLGSRHILSGVSGKIQTARRHRSEFAPVTSIPSISSNLLTTVPGFSIFPNLDVDFWKV